MTTYNIKHNNQLIGKVVVDGDMVNVYEIHRRRKLKSWVWFLLGMLCMLSGLVTIRAYISRMDEYYNACDAGLGYKADYYDCRQWHIKGGE